MAAAHAARRRCDPRALAAGGAIRAIQRDLSLADHHIHALDLAIDGDMAAEAQVTASSVFCESDAAESWGTDRLSGRRMLQLPVTGPRLERIELLVDAGRETVLRYAFHQGPANGSTFPEEKLVEGSVTVPAGQAQWVELAIEAPIRRPGWHFLVLEQAPDLAVHMTEAPPGKRWYYPRPADPIRPNPFSEWTSRALTIGMRRAVDADGAALVVPDWNDRARAFTAESGFLNFAYRCRTTPEQRPYEPAMVVNGSSRPTNLPNLWVSAPAPFDTPEWIELTWPAPRSIGGVQLLFDSALHFHFWQSWQGYPVNAIPSLVRDYRIIARHGDGGSSIVAEVAGNFQRNRRHAAALDDVVSLRVEVRRTNGLGRAQIYAIRVFGRGLAGGNG
jgi:hypothetical protein